MKFFLSFSIFILLSACGGGGGGGSNGIDFTSNNINNIPTCSDTGTSFQTTEYNSMSAGYSNNGLRTVCASTAYANGATGGTGVKIGFNDTGIMLQSDGDMGHQEFGTVGSSNSRVVIANNSDVVRWDNIPQDEDGHGTHVAGLIGADKDNVGMHGVAYNSTLYPIKTLTPRGSPASVAGIWTVAWGFYLADVYNVDIINNSWGYPNSEIGVTCNSQSSCESALNTAEGYAYTYYYFQRMVTQQNAMMVWAAGNDGLSNPSALNGACIYDSLVRENCVIVAALGVDGKIATLNNTNNVYSSNKCGIAAAYCITAPGSVKSSYYSNSSSYANLQGTSMAAPIVSGGLALIKQKFPSLSHAQVIDRLFATAIDHDIYSQSSIYGHGLMDLGAATSAIGTLQVLSTGSNLDTSFSNYSEMSSNTFSAGDSFNSSLNFALKNKTMEVYDSHDRANFSVYLSSFLNNDYIDKKYSIDNHLNNLLLADDYQQKKISKYGELSFNSRNNLNSSLFASFDKRINIGTNISANTFFNQSKKSFGVNTPLINNKLFDNPYFYESKQNLSLSLNGKYLSSELFTNDEATNFGYSINFQPTSRNYLDNDKYGDIEVSFGTTFEKNKILNSFSTGVFNTNELSSTKFARLKYNRSVDDLNLFANINFGSSEIKSNNNFYIRNTDSILTRSYALGLIKNNFIEQNNKFAFIISQPQKVIDGHMKLTVPTSSNSDREVTYTDYNLNLASSATEINYDLFYIMKLNQENSLYFNFTHIDNPNHDASLNSHNNVSLVYKKFF
tara:strand:+ start:133 stop:2487 length:2355 start_codon:yes stop_codon:yes gene_type:complete